MSTGYQNQSDPWRDEAQKFRAVAVIVLLIFAGFIFYDGKQTYIRYIKRCVEDSKRPDCGLLSATPKSTPQEWTMLEQSNGKWAIQLEAMNDETANKNSNRLSQAGMKPRLIRIANGRKGTLNYIQLGRFQTVKEALAAGSQLKERGFLQTFSVSGFRTSK